MSENFILDPILEKDSIYVKSLELCELRLNNNKFFPWVILIPKLPNIVEIIDLKFEKQQILLREINEISQLIKIKFNPYKINIAIFGNIVRQLHIHIIARFETDLAWPKPVWLVESEKYSPKEIENIKNILCN